MDRTIFTWVLNPRVNVVVVGRWRRILGWIRRPRLEGVVDVVIDQPTVLERMLDRDLVVWAQRIQELLEVVLWRTRLRRVALGAQCLALDCRNQVVVVTSLVVLLLLLLEARGRPLTMVHDLLPLVLRGVKNHCDRHLTVCIVARDVEELSRGSRRAAPESVDEGGAGHAVLER
jgi:hypothetical protein